jgi:hypothetical protein
MKTENNYKKLLSSGERSKINIDLNGIASVKGGKGLVNWLIKLIDVVSDERKPSWTRSSVCFARQYWRLRTTMGPKGTVKYLKACYVLTMQAVGGMKIKDPRSLGIAVSRSSDGLPRIIPRLQREMIRSGDPKAIRIWLSWFSIYRIIQFDSTASLSTITDPGKVLTDSVKNELASVIEAANNLWNQGGSFGSSLSWPTLKMLYRSSPTVSSLDFKKERVWKYSASLIGIEQGAVSLVNSSVLQSFYAVEYLMSQLAGQVSINLTQMIHNIASTSSMQPSYIGRLGFKQEAAGKVRVFAMVDCWTQWLLGPLHQSIFKLLETFPTDGTFDQHRPVKRLIEKGFTKFWCFDLSAATDRLPVSIQASLLDALVCEGFGTAWAELLVGRDYELPDSSLLKRSEKVVSSVRYSVGQPMGALSSWGMLALTHHLLVMLSAKKAGFPPGTFTSYAVLGDDIVIANGPVAQQYLIVLEAIGVKVGLAKSLVSKKGALEFAKKFFVKEKDCSPVALKEVAAAVSNPTFGISFMEKFSLRFATMLTVLGFGYRVKARISGYLTELPRRVQSLGIGLYSPWGPYPLDVLTWLSIKGFNPCLLFQAQDIQWSPDARDQLLAWVDKLSNSKWPDYLEDNSVLRFTDLQIPQGHRFKEYNDNNFGVYGKEPIGDMNIFNSLQAAVYNDLQAQRLGLQELHQVALNFKWAPGTLEDDLLKVVDFERKLRLFRSPRQIVHADTKSNRLGLGFQVRVWNLFKKYITSWGESSQESSDEVKTEERDQEVS